jgi:transcriptional regulator with XRE-family HTH domain
MMQPAPETCKTIEPRIFRRRFLHGRHVRNLRIRDVARLAGTSRQLLDDLSAGRKLPTPSLVKRLAEVLGVRPEWLAGLVS